MSTNQRQEAIRHVIWRQNPFHATPTIKLHRRGLKRVGHAIRISTVWTGFFRLVFTGSEIFSKGIANLIGLLAGICLAAGITGLGSGVAMNLLEGNLADISLGWFTIQSWRDYTGGILVMLTLYCLPYLWWGLPLTLAFRACRPVHHFFAQRRLWHEYQYTYNDDLSLLAKKTPGFSTVMSRNRRLQMLIRWIAASGKVVGSLTGFMATLLLIVLWIKFVILIWNKGNPFWQMMIGWLSCLAGVYMPVLILHAFRSGQAVATMIIALFQGNTYREALDDALDDLLTES